MSLHSIHSRLDRSPSRVAAALVPVLFALPAFGQSTQLVCKPSNPTFIDNAICAGDVRLCARFFELDAKAKSIREIPPSPDSTVARWSEAVWSDSFVEMSLPDRVQKWPNGRTAYVVRSKETLNRFTGELVVAYTTWSADSRYLPREEALQIARALGDALVAAPSYGSTSYSCEKTARRL
jgi:hypothetical protein